MANEFINAERVVSTILGLLEREIVVPQLVWRDAGGSFIGAKDDTITLRLPAYASARTRALRSTDAITLGQRVETSVDVKLDTHIYDAVAITDAELTLDIEDFARQVLMPGVRAVARGIEDNIVSTITGATYPSDHTIELDESKPENTVTRARRLLNEANVPMDGRAILAGSAIDEVILNAENIVRVDASGSDSALRDAEIGRLRGFRIFTSNAIPPGEAYAFHMTAYALSLQAPVVPDGATWGSSAAAAGLSMRALRDYDFLNVRDRLLTDVFAGSSVVEDKGEFDANGKWVPWDGEDHEPDAQLVRAVKITHDES